MKYVIVCDPMDPSICDITYFLASPGQGVTAWCADIKHAATFDTLGGAILQKEMAVSSFTNPNNGKYVRVMEVDDTDNKNDAYERAMRGI